MKILQVINQLEGGGAERLVRQLHGLFVEKGHEVLTVALQGKVPKEDGFCSAGLKRLCSPWSFSRFRRVLAKVLEEKEFTPDVVHTHLTQSQFLVPRVYPKTLPSPIWITTEHSTENRRRNRFWGRSFDRTLYREYDAIIAISSSVNQFLGRWLPEVRSRIVTIPNGVDLLRFKNLVREFDGSLRVLSVGRLEKVKNMDGLLKALSGLDCPWSCTIAGVGTEEASLKEWVSEKGLSNRVVFTGFVDDVSALYADADVAVLYSRFEGFGLAAVEAMASGKPTIVSDVPGLREVVGPNLPKADPEDPESLTRQLQLVASDEVLRKKYSEEGLRRSQEFDIKRTAQGYIDLYAERMND